MTALSHPYLLGGGAFLLLVGFGLWRWASRHDLKGLAVDAAWQLAKNKGNLATETELGNRFKDLKSDTSNVSRAKKAVGYGVRHVVAQVATLAGIVGMLGGAGLIAAAFYWK